MWLDWFKKEKGAKSEKSVSEQTNTSNKHGGVVYDEIIKVDNIIYCYCSSLDKVCRNGAKILKHFGNYVDQEHAEEILDGLKFIINEFPSQFPMEKMHISLKDSRAIQINDTIHITTSYPEYDVSYSLYVGADGLGWTILTRSSMDESHLYKNSKNYFWVTDEYSIKNVYEFINAALNVMGYASVSIPVEKRNLVKPKYADANIKSPEEEYQIGLQYYYGKDLDIDYDKAFQHFKNSAEGDNGKGMYFYACCLLEGKGTPKDPINGRIWLVKACKKNIALAYERIGYAYRIKGEFRENNEISERAFAKAFELFEKEASNGDAEATYHLARCYFYGNGVKDNIKKAIELLHKAIDAGWDEACYEMAVLHKIGIGVEMSDKESFMWYNKAAEMGNVDAIYNIGLCYESGTGVIKDLKKAFEWYMKGAQKKHAHSQYKVGMCFLNGVGTEKNLDNAFTFLNIAGNKGFKDAARIVQQLLLEDTEQDF